jgi:hypothetical protein
MPLPEPSYLKDIAIVHYGPCKPIRVHKDDLDEFINFIAFAPQFGYDSRLEHQKQCDPNNPWDTYAFMLNYLWQVSNIAIEFPQ